jgi:hypothetical protein
MRTSIAIMVVFAGLAAGVLGYGWWHSGNHATIHVTLRDAAKKQFEYVKGAQLEFLDEAGRVLARGKSDDQYGVVWVSHPTAGYCGPDLAQPAYAQCFRVHSEWLLTWVPQVRRITIATGRCRIEHAPIHFSASRDSAWTWWIPLPHVGGTPYTNFNAFVQVDVENCAVVPLRG